MSVRPNRYDLTQVVVIDATFTDAAGAPDDPSDVILYAANPLAVPAVQTFKLSLGQVARDGVGLYHVDFTPGAHGWWEYQWQGTGNVQTAGQVTKFYVRPSFAIAG